MRFILAFAGLLLTAWLSGSGQVTAEPLTLEQIEQQRIKVINQVRPSVVAVFATGGRGGGSGVVIDPEGYALTNFHVVSGLGPTMQCGLPDGVLYDAVLVGLDKVGDVALIKLLPKEEGKPFPYATMGDSDKVRPGDWSIAMGNPFLLATDFTPTVTFGLISGVHRYQYPGGKGLLEYTDCIQIDTSINPGNSGGPLFNLTGELIGINGRGSFDKRGRVNSGVGYAISINQIKNFLGHLYAGIDTDHATLGVRVETPRDDALGRVIVTEALENADAYRRGLDLDDEMVSFAGRPVTSVNQYKNILGIFPEGWRVPLVYRRNNDKQAILVRLMGNQVQPNQPDPEPQRPPGRRQPTTPKPDSPANKYYKAKKGFANYYFNEQKQAALLDKVRAVQGDFAKLAGDWSMRGTFTMADRKGAMVCTFRDNSNEGGQASPVIKLTLNVDYRLEPLSTRLSESDLLEPINSGGLMVALHNWRRFLLKGKEGFEADFYHGGYEPFYRQPLEPGAKDELVDLMSLRHDTEVLHSDHASIRAKWYFSQKEPGKLLGFETWVSDRRDPCEVYLHDYKPVAGRMLPHTFEVRHGDKRYAILEIQEYTFQQNKTGE